MVYQPPSGALLMEFQRYCPIIGRQDAGSKHILRRADPSKDLAVSKKDPTQFSISIENFNLSHERKKHPKKICVKNFGGTLAGGSRRGLRPPNSLCRCWFSQQNTVHKEFRGGGGSKGVLGVGSKVQFWGPISLCLCAFLGRDWDSSLESFNPGAKCFFQS